MNLIFSLSILVNKTSINNIDPSEIGSSRGYLVRPNEQNSKITTL